MTSTSSAEPGTSPPARRLAHDEALEKAPDPARHFSSPELLVADQSLSDNQKVALLEEWARDIDHRLGAEDEGMGQAAPLRSEHEARLADEAARVKAAMASLAAGQENC